jgi:hypothetical protein
VIRRAFIVVALVVGLAFMGSQTAHASTTTSPLSIMAACSAGGVTEFLGLKAWDSCLDHNANGAPEIKSLAQVWLIILPLLEDAIKIAGYTAAGFVIWGGVKYVKSQGDPSQFNEARQVIYNALFGLFLAMISVAIVNFIAGAIR